MIKKTVLSEDWKLYGFSSGEYDIEAICKADFQCTGWYGIRIPQDVHTTLIENKVIKDPAYGYNAAECAWVEKKVWIYRKKFSVSGEILGSRKLLLVFEGLDTYASIYLNGKKLADYSNMFIEHRLEVTGLLETGENTLVVEFHVMSEMAKRELPEGFWINYSWERAYARKAAYSYGWDWTPRIATVGIWKPVLLEAYNTARLCNVQIKTAEIDREARTARLKVNVGTENISGSNLSYRLTLTENDGSSRVFTSAGRSFEIKVEEARFWWTSDIGDPYLYTVTLDLLDNGAVEDSWQCNYGIRTIEVRQHSEDRENRFLFVLNGVELFARGANWVPVSNSPAAVKEEQYVRLLAMAGDAGMNMLCLWGGGIYEHDVFYDSCDKLGILVWQYFMFACGEYPGDDAGFLECVHEEIEKAVIRLRNHPSIAIWVGNVEGRMLCEKIGLPRPMHGEEMFERHISDWLAQLDDTRFYMPTSPQGVTTANSMTEGDRHNWDVWFTDVPYTDYAKDTATFVSEYGIHAAPARATIEKYLECRDPDINSHLFKYLNKDQSLRRMYYLMEMHAAVPGDIDEYVDYSMFVQAEGLKFGTEHYRRNFPHTGGALIWQLNDCCPVHSWSMIDCDLIPKASYYYSKRFFAPLLVSLEEVDAITTALWLINNTVNDYEDRIVVTVKDFFGNAYFSEEIKASIKANTSVRLKSITVGGRYYPNIIIPDRHRNFYVHAHCRDGLQEAFRFFGNFSEIPLPDARLEVKAEEGKLLVSTDRFARFVKIDGELEGLELSDNYFNLPAGCRREVRTKVHAGKPLRQRQLFAKALNSSPQTVVAI